jgi:hypothetical protein
MNKQKKKVILGVKKNIKRRKKTLILENFETKHLNNTHE